MPLALLLSPPTTKEKQVLHVLEQQNLFYLSL